MLFDNVIAVLDTEPHPAALNMAIDETLLLTAVHPTLRIYRWARPSTSFGYFGKWSDAFTTGPDRDIVRRWTGGGIVRHGQDFTYSLIVPRSHPFFSVSPRESYCAIHECIASAIGHASLAPAAQPQVSSECFQNPVQHDVVIGHRKIAGGAQRRTKSGLLHQGSIQNIDDAGHLSARLICRFSARHSAIPLAPETAHAAEILSQEKYATDEWTKRA